MDMETNALWNFTRLDKDVTTPFNVSVQHYLGSAGNYLSDQASGAYIFRPALITETPIVYNEMTKLSVFNGRVVDLAVAEYGERALQHYKLYKKASNYHVNT